MITFLEELLLIIVFAITSSYVITKLSATCFIHVHVFKYISVLHYLPHSKAHTLGFSK